MNTITKWDKWRSLLLWWSKWTLFTVGNAVQSSRRIGAGVVVAIIKSDLVNSLESLWWRYRIVWHNYNQSDLQNLINMSHSAWLWFWLEEDFNDNRVKSFYIDMINNLPYISVIDADLIIFIKKNREQIKYIPTHIFTMNINETEQYFGSKDPDIEIVQKECRELWCWIVLKWWVTKIVWPIWELEEIDTSHVPEMINAWMWDVLTWLVTGLLSQWYDPLKAIEKAIAVRENAAKYYLKNTQDIIVLPEDVIINIPYIVRDTLNP